MAIFCEKCGDSGFAGNGTGYGDVCDECGGQSAAALDDTKLLREKCDSLRAELSAARRAGKAEGLMTTRRMAELLREFIGEHDAAKGSAFGCRCGTCCRARDLIARAEEVERE